MKKDQPDPSLRTCGMVMKGVKHGTLSIVVKKGLAFYLFYYYFSHNSCKICLIKRWDWMKVVCCKLRGKFGEVIRKYCMKQKMMQKFSANEIVQVTFLIILTI